MELSVLEVSHYRKEYGDHIAVRDLSLSVAPGEICGFIGHNGAGKTTLIRSVVGAQPPTSGAVRVCGHDVWRDAIAAKRLMAYVPDNPDIYTFMTGIQYLTFMADVFEVPRDVREERITSLAGRLGILDDLASPIGSYSHGMRQKLVVIGALLHKPKLLILDEPFVGLDPVASHELKEILHEHAARGGAVFFSSHVLEVVEKLCNKVAIIRKGELVRAGTTDEVRGDDSLEDVFLELAEVDAAAPDGASSEDGRHA